MPVPVAGISPHECGLSFVFRVVLRDPALDQDLVLSGCFEQFRCLGIGGPLGGVIIDQVSLAPTGFEVVRESPSCGTEDESGGFERNLAVTWKRGGNPIASAGKSHLGQLEDCVVGGGECAVGGQARYGGIIHVSRNELAQTGEFIRAGQMALEALTCQKCGQTQGDPPG